MAIKSRNKTAKKKSSPARPQAVNLMKKALPKQRPDEKLEEDLSFYQLPEGDDGDDEEDQVDDDDEDEDDEVDEEEDDDDDIDYSDADDEDGLEEYTAKSYLQGHVIPLPSGKAVRVTPVSLLSMIDNGTMPPHLLAAARKQMYGKDDKLARAHEAILRQNKQRIGTNNDLLNFLCCQMIASFKCVDKAQVKCRNNEVSVHQLFEADKLAILSFAMQGQQALKNFRRK